jgi:hypothetical protein
MMARFLGGQALSGIEVLLGSMLNRGGLVCQSRFSLRRGGC